MNRGINFTSVSYVFLFRFDFITVLRVWYFFSLYS